MKEGALTGWLSMAALAVALCASGCDDLVVQTTPPTAPKAKPKKVVKKVLTPSKENQPKVDASEELALIDKAFQASQKEQRFASVPEEAAAGRVTEEIEKYVELDPTLVVWLVDRTPSAHSLANSALSAARHFYQSQKVKQWRDAGDRRLITAVAAVDDKVEFLLDPPSDDPAAIEQALEKVGKSDVGKELTFSAVKQILQRYEDLRAAPRQMVLVLVTDEAGDDAALADELVPRLKKNVIPIYVIGVPAPWGQANPFQKLAGRFGNPADGQGPDAFPTHGPESHASERVHLPLPTPGFGFRSPQFDDLVDAGFGPLGLERLCRAGGGAFIAVRPSGGSFSFGGIQTWPTGAEMRFEPEAASRYAPDYVTAEEYQALLAESKARQALCAAAKIGRADILESPTLRFAKTADEAAMKRQLDQAQQGSARVAPQIDRLYEALQPGEADREKLTGRRWQAQFDYALGRVLAAKVRNDSYNQMIANLKAGKGPKDVTEYVLEPADSYETSSALKKMADKAKTYLERVVKEHPGTPWAKFAEEDLKVPMGWKWQGSTVEPTSANTAL